ncbi:MAG: hypothetical protein R2862_05530 [Thermoanaerobaculia bacterium]
MALPAAVPLAADEAPGFRPEATLMQQRVPAPLRLAESAALEPIAQLAPSAQSAPGRSPPSASAICAATSCDGRSRWASRESCPRRSA